MAPGCLKILIASMQQYLISILHDICSYVCILFELISLFLQLMVHMLWYVPYMYVLPTDEQVNR